MATNLTRAVKELHQNQTPNPNQARIDAGMKAAKTKIQHAEAANKLAAKRFIKGAQSVGYLFLLNNTLQIKGRN